MRITESKLRRLIRSVILENSMFQYEQDDYDKQNDLASDLSSVFYILNEYKYDLDDQNKIQELINEPRLSGTNESDIRMFIEKDEGWMGSNLKVSFDFFNKLGYDDNIIERACDYGDNSYWMSCYPGSEGRYIQFSDPDNI